jgi:hypothetical protein
MLLMGAIMDWVGVLGLITGIISIPSSVYAIGVWRRELAARKSSLATSVQAAKGASVSVRAERVLLRFDNTKIDTPGTFENAAMSFVRAYRAPVCYLKLDISNAWGTYVVNESMLRVYAHQSVHAIVGMLLTWIGVIIAWAIARPADIGTVGFGEILILLVFNTLVGLVFGAWSYSSRQTAERHRIARDVAKAYQDYLDSRGIRFAFECTQLKRIFDQERAALPQLERAVVDDARSIAA